MGRNKKRGGSGQGLQSSACVRALLEQGGGIRYVRRNGAHSVSDRVGKEWWERSRDIDDKHLRYSCFYAFGIWSRQNSEDRMAYIVKLFMTPWIVFGIQAVYIRLFS